MAETKVLSELNARVWKIEVAVGDRVAADDTLLILESMKTEIPVEAPRTGRVAGILVAEEQPVTEGQVLVLLE
ncbi:MAG: acetyl-CoA carboxylase biotin carboxyl carrier protein subunit [Rhodospirillales bacterium 70-18]|nr:acetyl-CoA carboxylase biotin carboxyl carrier protein subunit [Rhodospirillales bacterium]OJY73148.1 MAG: acetyl-CoA carboxylase biotin carboxyl carrier protein subunit [Rhodospirillales bacterium 70-18]